MGGLRALAKPPWPVEIAALVALALVTPLFESPKAVIAGLVIVCWLVRYVLLERSLHPMVLLDWAGLARFVTIVVSALYGVYLLDDWDRLADANHDVLIVALVVLLARVGYSDRVARWILGALVAGSVLALGSLVAVPSQHSLSANAILALSNANITAFYLAMTAAVTLAFLIENLRRQQWLWTVVPGLVLTAHFAGIAFTGSRAGAGMTLTGTIVVIVLGLGCCLGVRPDRGAGGTVVR